MRFSYLVFAATLACVLACTTTVSAQSFYPPTRGYSAYNAGVALALSSPAPNFAGYQRSMTYTPSRTYSNPYAYTATPYSPGPYAYGPSTFPSMRGVAYYTPTYYYVPRVYTPMR